MDTNKSRDNCPVRESTMFLKVIPHEFDSLSIHKNLILVKLTQEAINLVIALNEFPVESCILRTFAFHTKPDTKKSIRSPFERHPQSMTRARLSATTTREIARMYNSLDYAGLGPIYCDEGGDSFWQDRRGPCQKMGIAIAKGLRARLAPQGRSLYVGAGVPEIPVLLMERLELDRTVCPYNLRLGEVNILNQAGGEHGVPFRFGSADSAAGTFDHLWIVSVLNDPEEFPNLSVLFSYGRADPLAFDTSAFSHERETGIRLFANCMAKLTTPGLLTTSVEEIPWVDHWCRSHSMAYEVADRTYPTALVGDPVCFIRIG